MQVRQGARSYALPATLSPTADVRDERGVTAVEFAIIVPLLMMVLFGIMGFGFAMAQSASLASGAREGARLGGVSGVVAGSGDHDCGDVVARAREQAQTIAVQPTDVEVKVYRVSSANAATLVCQAATGAANPSSSATLPETRSRRTLRSAASICPARLAVGS